MKASLSYSRARYVVTLVLIALAIWTGLHVFAMIAVGSIAEYFYSHWIFIGSFLLLTLSLTIANRERAVGSVSATANLRTTVVVPAYNEDPTLLYNCLDSILTQSRPVTDIYVIDDGSNSSDYGTVKEWFEYEAPRRGVETHWIRQDNGGKRHAQSRAFELATDTDIFITVDSDSVLDEHAVREVVRPFSDPTIQSVAGVVLARNNRVNLLARITDLLFVTGQLIDRSMMSNLGSVLVNSGGLAAYRASNIRNNLDAYLNETFFGHHVEFSDDSMLTLYSLDQGKTIQQPTAFVFTEMPAKMSHHLRQQTRWMKGSFIRSWWRLKYLPLLSFGFMRQASGWIQFTVTTTLLAVVLIASPHIPASTIPYMVLTPILLGYAQALRYLSVSRSDESIYSQLLTFALTPLAVLWSYFILRPLRVYASVTCFRSGWGTRQVVEDTQVVMQAIPTGFIPVPQPMDLPAPVIPLVATAHPSRAQSYSQYAAAARERFMREYSVARHSARVARSEIRLSYARPSTLAHA